MKQLKNKIREGAANLLKFLLDALYPPRCPVCQDILPQRRQLVHEKCRKKLQYVSEPLCKKCGKPLEDSDEEYCRDCLKKRRSYDEGRAVFVYDQRMREGIYRFKYQNRREYAVFYSEEIIERLGDCLRRWNPDALIPVPLHRSRMRKRGYNQALLLAEGVSRRTGIPVRNDIVIRCRKTIPQKDLNYEERQNNLKKAFKIVKNDVKLSTVVIIDDIYTTGSTADAVAAAFKQAGSRKVYCISLAVGRSL